MFTEPAHTPFDLNFRVLGIPVRVHPLFWLVTLFMKPAASPKAAAIWVFAVFVSILIHELGHAIVARACGFAPWIVLHGFGGLAIYQPTYHNWKRQVLISLAGPGAGFFFAAFIAAAFRAAGHRVSVEFGFPFLLDISVADISNRNLDVLVQSLFFINIWWGLINLLPVIPLDGGQISRELFVAGCRYPQTGVIRALQLSLLTGGLIAIFAFVELHSFYIGLLFGFFAYQSFSALQTYSGGRPW